MGFPLSPPRPKRRRISEFLGVAKTGSAGPGRRAVSGLIKVEEDTAMEVDIEVSYMILVYEQGLS